jgi:hypothetical protein
MGSDPRLPGQVGGKPIVPSQNYLRARARGLVCVGSVVMHSLRTQYAASIALLFNVPTQRAGTA